jgi:hypothetical protein
MMDDTMCEMPYFSALCKEVLRYTIAARSRLVSADLPTSLDMYDHKLEVRKKVLKSDMENNCYLLGEFIV